ncbi:MAG: MarR family transcriptional regulator [Firmicutes bacterium]|nr:MarR family transcriptional regulator [Bacillota bacterium]
MEEPVTDLMLLRLFRQCAHLQYHRYSRFQGQGRILTLLTEQGPMTQRELAEITQRRSATLSEQLELMEHAGWITRRKNCEDRRNVDLRLTPAGRKAAQEALQEREQTAKLLFSMLSGEEKKNLFQTLETLERAWSRPAQEQKTKTSEQGKNQSCGAAEAGETQQ